MDVRKLCLIALLTLLQGGCCTRPEPYQRLYIIADQGQNEKEMASTEPSKPKGPEIDPLADSPIIP